MDIVIETPKKNSRNQNSRDARLLVLFSLPYRLVSAPSASPLKCLVCVQHGMGVFSGHSLEERFPHCCGSEKPAQLSSSSVLKGGANQPGQHSSEQREQQEWRRGPLPTAAAVCALTAAFRPGVRASEAVQVLTKQG